MQLQRALSVSYEIYIDYALWILEKVIIEPNSYLFLRFSYTINHIL